MQLYEYLKIFHEISPIQYNILREEFKTKSCKKNEHLIVPGQIQKELYFVKKGVQMSTYEAENKSITVAFTYPPNLCAIPESFSLQKPSQYFLTCITDSEFDSISYDQLQLLFDHSQGIERLFRKMNEALLAGVINRHIELQTLTIQQRYKSFCVRSPHLLQMVPHKYIASYLNIDNTNFSKLYNTVKI
jgi:CRP-like cAMP-binding protein